MRHTMSSSPLPLRFSTNFSPAKTHHDHSPVQLLPSTTPSHTHWPKDQPNPHNKPRTIRYRLSQLCREGQPHLARQLFDTIPRPTTVVWNSIIIGFICNNMAEEAILLYSQMKSRSFGCDPYTYSSILKACAETRSLRIGKAVHCHILRSHLYPSKIVCNSLLNMYATCLDDGVERVFGTMRKRNVISWNILISWYVKVDRFVEAVTYFMRMMKTGLKPTVVSFVNVLPAVARMGDSKLADILYGLLLKMGNEYSWDVFATSSAISMYSELACLRSARMVFENSLERNTEVWNTMIGGYVQNNCPVEALDLFIQALKAPDDVVLDDVTFISALTAASQLQQLNFAEQLHAYILKSATVLGTIVFNALIVMYSRCNCIEASFKVFNSMNGRDTVSWNTMISSFVQNGMNDEGLMLVREMQKQGFLIDDVTITAVLSLASNLRNKEIGKQSHCYLLRHNIEFEGMESYLIDMYAKSGLIREAQEVFERNCSHGRDQATWNAIIAGNCQNGLIEQAFCVFRQMLEQNVPPNAVTISSILPGCTLAGSITLAKQLHAYAIRRSLDQNVFVHSALVDVYSKLGIITSAESVFAQSFEKNAVTYTNMILGYGQHGMGRKSLQLFNSMREDDIEPDSVTLVAVLSACSYAGLVDEGLQLFESMEREYKVVPSLEHFCCVVDMLGRVGKVSEAYEFVKGLGEQGNVLRIWGSLLGSCRTHGNFELGKIVADKLREIDVRNNTTGYHVLLSNMYAEEGNWDCVDRVRKEMYEKGMAKETGCSWIGDAGYLNYFVPRDRKHSRSDEIYEMLGVLATDMKDSGYTPCLVSDRTWISESDG